MKPVLNLSSVLHEFVNGVWQKAMWRGVSGKAQVIIGDIGIVRNRNIPAANPTYSGSANKATWAVPVVSISVTPITYPCLVVFGCAADNDASTALGDQGTPSTDVQYHYAPAGATFTQQFDGTGVSRVDVLPIGGVTRVVVGAVEVPA